MWLLVVTILHLLVGIVTIYPYSLLYYKIYTDQSFEFRPWFRRSWTPGIIAAYIVLWPGFMAYAVYKFVKLLLREHQRDL